MDPKFQTSFIPKQPLAQPAVYRRSGGINLFFLISFIIFFAVLAAAAAVYLYEKTIRANISEISIQLAQARSDLDPVLVKELKRVDSRIQSAKAILGSHHSVAALLALLGESTLSSGVSFESFDYLVDEKVLKVNIKGVATNFSAVAIQSAAILENPKILNPIFSDVNLDQAGNVNFSLIFTVDPASLQYGKLPVEEPVLPESELEPVFQ